MNDLHWSTVLLLLILAALVVRCMIWFAEKQIAKYWNTKEGYGP